MTRLISNPSYCPTGAEDPQYIVGTGMFPPIVLEMQIGSTNNHIPQIFFVLVVPMYWWEMANCFNTNGALKGAA
jgi:hypothetical protein